MPLRITLFFLCLFFSRVYAQDTTAMLPEVGVWGDRLQKFGMGAKVITIDSAILSNNSNTSLAEVLAQYSGAFIKNYGPGNLSTIALRGTNASQTAVLWNGFNLQSAMLGQVDFSLLPTHLAEEIKIQHGGASTLYGSGAIGGAIHINNKSSYNSGWRASSISNIGSFRNLQQTFSVKYGSARYSGSLNIFYKEAANNFPYRTSGGDRRIQMHANVMQRGWLHESYFKLPQKQEINLLIWYMNADRQLPASTESYSSKATQQDESWRISSQWKHEHEKLTLAARVALLTERLTYQNYDSSLTNAITAVGESEATYRMSNLHTWHLGLNYTGQQVVSTNFANVGSMNRASIFSNYKIRNRSNTLLGSVGIRKEFITNFAPAPITPCVGVEYKVLKKLSLLLNGSRNYRVPTLNDLYWQDGAAIGNKDLLPESAWTADAGAKLNVPLAKPESKRQAHLDISGNYYYGYIFNYIQWQPNQNGQWSPENINEVSTRGVELTNSFTYQIGNFNLKISIATNYVLSTNEKARSAQDNSYKKQLIYVPIYNHQGNIMLTCKHWQMNYSQTYTGYRYTTADNKNALSPYHLGNLRVGKNMNIKSFALNLSLQANNLWNTQYQAVQYYAMPGRHWLLSLKINFHKDNS